MKEKFKKLWNKLKNMFNSSSKDEVIQKLYTQNQKLKERNEKLKSKLQKTEFQNQQLKEENEQLKKRIEYYEKNYDYSITPEYIDFEYIISVDYGGNMKKGSILDLSFTVYGSELKTNIDEIETKLTDKEFIGTIIKQNFSNMINKSLSYIQNGIVKIDLGTVKKDETYNPSFNTYNLEGRIEISNSGREVRFNIGK
jgi:FtsZ-binding cell division protein ZapB